jgi:hypothetical protein
MGDLSDLVEQVLFLESNLFLESRIKYSIHASVTEAICLRSMCLLLFRLNGFGITKKRDCGLRLVLQA